MWNWETHVFALPVFWQIFLKRYKGPSDHWIGLHRVSTEHPWIWTDNTEYSNLYVFRTPSLILYSFVLKCVSCICKRWMAMLCEANCSGKKESINRQSAGLVQNQSGCLKSEPIPANTPNFCPLNMLPFIGHHFQGIYLIQFFSKPLTCRCMGELLSVPSPTKNFSLLVSEL